MRKTIGLRQTKELSNLIVRGYTVTGEERFRWISILFHKDLQLNSVTCFYLICFFLVTK